MTLSKAKSICLYVQSHGFEAYIKGDTVELRDGVDTIRVTTIKEMKEWLGY